MSEENIENVTKSDSNFTPTFVGVKSDISLSEISFNGLCLINNNISIPKKSIKFIYFLQAKFMVKKFKHKF